MSLPNSEAKFRNQLILGIFVALALWGLYLAIGGGWGSLFTKSGDLTRGNKPILKALIIFSCSAAFLLFWALMLWQRSARLQREAEEEAADDEDTDHSDTSDASE